jgi:flagellin-like protein
MAKRKSLKKNKKALSPVIATVILVAVTITVAIAVAYWMGGIAGLYTRLEKVEVTSVSQSYSAVNGWTLTIGLKNTGSADANVDNLMIDGNLYSSMGVTCTPDIATSPLLVSAGSATVTLSVRIPIGTHGCSSGTTIDLKLHTAAGKEYPSMVTLT